jgi:RNA polymerase subunit RPABC4/transcription elongation factor Spt4
MHGRHFGGGRHHWGGGRRWGGGWGGGFGWVFPAMILGRLVSEALERHAQGQAPAEPAPPVPPSAPANTPRPAPTPAWSEAAPPTVRCANCGRGVEAGHAFCPHCGQSVSRRECRYCGREFKADQRACVGCGAPATSAQS